MKLLEWGEDVLFSQLAKSGYREDIMRVMQLEGSRPQGITNNGLVLLSQTGDQTSKIADAYFAIVKVTGF